MPPIQIGSCVFLEVFAYISDVKLTRQDIPITKVYDEDEVDADESNDESASDVDMSEESSDASADEELPE